MISRRDTAQAPPRHQEWTAVRARLQAEGKAASELRAPALSIIVPLRNEARHLESFLLTVRALRYTEAPVEMFLVEGASADDTRARLEAALPGLREAHRSWRFRILDNPGGRIPDALNIGIHESTGDVIVRLDAHTLFPPHYLEACAECLQATRAANVGGVVVAVPGAETSTGRAIARARSDLFGAGGSSFRTGFSSGLRATVPFGCFPVATFERYGQFDARLLRNQDIEFNHRIRAGGGAVYQNGDIVAHYLAPPDFASLARKHFANGAWNIYATVLRPGCLTRAHAVPGLFLLLVAAAAVVNLWAAAALLGLLLAADFWRAWRVGRGVSRWRLGVSLAVIQLAHGLGQIKGILTVPLFLARAR